MSCAPLVILFLVATIVAGEGALPPCIGVSLSPLDPSRLSPDTLLSILSTALTPEEGEAREGSGLEAATASEQPTATLFDVSLFAALTFMDSPRMTLAVEEAEAVRAVVGAALDIDARRVLLQPPSIAHAAAASAAAAAAMRGEDGLGAGRALRAIAAAAASSPPTAPPAHIKHDLTVFLSINGFTASDVRAAAAALQDAPLSPLLASSGGFASAIRLERPPHAAAAAAVCAAAAADPAAAAAAVAAALRAAPRGSAEWAARTQLVAYAAAPAPEAAVPGGDVQTRRVWLQAHLSLLLPFAAASLLAAALVRCSGTTRAADAGAAVEAGAAEAVASSSGRAGGAAVRRTQSQPPPEAQAESATLL